MPFASISPVDLFSTNKTNLNTRVHISLQSTEHTRSSHIWTKPPETWLTWSKIIFIGSIQRNEGVGLITIWGHWLAILLRKNIYSPSISYLIRYNIKFDFVVLQAPMVTDTILSFCILHTHTYVCVFVCHFSAITITLVYMNRLNP